jgi:hypothetical protein
VTACGGRQTLCLTAFVSRSVVFDLLVLVPGTPPLETLAPEALREFREELVQALRAFPDE